MGLFSKKQSLDDIYGVKGDRPSLLRMPESIVDKISNRHYHNNFRGYTEVRTADPSGRYRIQRVYTSPWKVSGLSNRNYWLVRCLFLFLAIASAVLYILAMVQDIPGNKHWAVAIPGLPAIICLFLVFVRLFLFFFAPRKMTLWDYESTSKKMRRQSLIAGIVIAVTGCALIVFAIVTQEEASRTILYGLMDILSALCCLAIGFIDSRLPYNDEQNDAVLPEGEQYPIR